MYLIIIILKEINKEVPLKSGWLGLFLTFYQNILYVIFNINIILLIMFNVKREVIKCDFWVIQNIGYNLSFLKHYFKEFNF